MSSNSTQDQIKELSKLESCKKATETLVALVDRNKATTEFNNQQTAAWGAAHNAWKNRKSAEETRMSNWENNSGEFSSFQTYKDNLSSEERFFRNCVDWGINGGNVKNSSYCVDDYGSGWQRVEGSEGEHGCSWGQGKSKCKRTTTQANSEFNTWKTNQPTKKPVFLEPEPKDKEGDFVHKHLEPAPQTAINCCANYMNITASEVQGNEQSCVQTIEQKRIELEKQQSTPAPAGAPSGTPQGAPVEKGPIQTPAIKSEEKVKVTEVTAGDDTYLFAGIGLTLVFIILMVILITILFLVF